MQIHKTAMYAILAVFMLVPTFAYSGEKIECVGKLMPPPSPLGRVNVGFSEGEGKEIKTDLMFVMENGEIIPMSAFGSAAVNSDGTFRLIIEKKNLAQHKVWTLYWEENSATNRRGALQDSAGNTLTFEIRDMVDKMELGQIKMKSK